MACELKGLVPRSVLPADEATEWTAGGERVPPCSEGPRRMAKASRWLVPAVEAEGKALARRSLAALRVKVDAASVERERKSAWEEGSLAR